MTARFGSVLALVSAMITACGTRSAPDSRAPASGDEQRRFDLIEHGKPFPRMKLTDLRDGSSFEVGAPSDRATLVFMFATWDGQWRAFPRLREFGKKNQPALRVVAISIDDPPTEKERSAEILEYVKRYGFDGPVAWEHAVIEHMAVPRSEPAFFLIDRRGVTRIIDGGYYPDIQEERESTMQKVIDER